MTKIRACTLQMVSLALIGAGLAFVANRCGPYRIPWVQDWSHHVEQLARADGIEVISLFEAVQALKEQSGQFVDARPADAFVTGRIPGAVNVPRGDHAALLRLFEGGGMLIVYCDGPSCDDGLMLCRDLKANGYEKLALFADGMDMWRRFDGPLETGGGQ